MPSFYTAKDADMSATVKHDHLRHVYIEKQWKNRAVECKNGPKGGILTVISD